MNAKQICGAIVALYAAGVAARPESLELKNRSLINGKFMGGPRPASAFRWVRQCRATMSLISVRCDSSPKRRVPSVCLHYPERAQRGSDRHIHPSHARCDGRSSRD
jgi:hypothetical protein